MWESYKIASRTTGYHFLFGRMDCLKEHIRISALYRAKNVYIKSATDVDFSCHIIKKVDIHISTVLKMA